MARCCWTALYWEVVWVKGTAICIRLCVCVFIPLILSIRCLLSKRPTLLCREEFSSTDVPLEAAISHPNEMYLVECFTLYHHCLVWVTLAAALFVFCSQSLIPAQAEGEWNIPQRREKLKKGKKKNRGFRLSASKSAADKQAALKHHTKILTEWNLVVQR